MKRYLLTLAVLVPLAAVAAAAGTAATPQERLVVELGASSGPSGHTRVAVSLDSSVAFVAPAGNDLVAAVAVGSGRRLGAVAGRAVATGLSLSESPERRLLAVTTPADREAGLPASVTVVDATRATEMRVVSAFSLPEGVDLAPDARAEIVSGQRFGVLAVGAPVGALMTFDVETGQQAGALMLEATPERIWVADGPDGSRVVCLLAGSNELVVAAAGAFGELLPVSTFEPPDGARLGGAGPVGFDATGRMGYVALPDGLVVSFALETGQAADSVRAVPGGTSLAVYHGADGDLIAVTHGPWRSGPLGAEPAADARVDRGAGAFFVVADAEGGLSLLSRFEAEPAENAGWAAGPGFTADGSTLVAPSRGGALFLVDVAQGRARRLPLAGRLEALAVAPLAEAVVVGAAGADGRRIEIIPLGTLPDAPEPTPGAEAVPAGQPAEPEASAVAAEPEPSAGRPLEVVPAMPPTATAPLVTAVKPETIRIRSSHVDLYIAGERFREGAVVAASYRDRVSGAEASAKLKTYRLGPTAIVAELPARVARRAESLELTVIDRDGLSESAPVRVGVAGLAWTLQVASYRDEAASRSLVDALHAAAVDAYTTRADLASRGVWYRVRVGRYASRAEAASAGRRLRAAGHVRDYFVTRAGAER
jgi:hypothetical protein